MKKTFTLFLLLLSISILSNAQKPDGNIKGKLVDTLGKIAVADATITLRTLV